MVIFVNVSLCVLCVWSRTRPLIRTAADLAAARDQGFTNGHYDHLRATKYHFSCDQQEVSQYYHWQPLVEYKIPVISYLDTVCPFAARNLPPSSPRRQQHGRHARTAFWGPNLHHGAEFHKFTAVLLAHAIHEYANHDISETSLDGGDLPSWMPHQAVLSKQQIADWNAYVYNSSTGAAPELDAKTIKCSVLPLQSKMKVAEHGSDWRYYEDVPGKPGWVCESSRSRRDQPAAAPVAAHAASVATPAAVVASLTAPSNPQRSIAFSVRLPRVQPIIKISVLMSYDPGMGVLRCCVDPRGPEHCHVFDTLWADQTSQLMTMDMAFPDFPDKSADSELKRVLTCTADNGKVKVVQIITC